MNERQIKYIFAEHVESAWRKLNQMISSKTRINLDLGSFTFESIDSEWYEQQNHNVIEVLRGASIGFKGNQQMGTCISCVFDMIRRVWNEIDKKDKITLPYLNLNIIITQSDVDNAKQNMEEISRIHRGFVAACGGNISPIYKDNSDVKKALSTITNTGSFETYNLQDQAVQTSTARIEEQLHCSWKAIGILTHAVEALTSTP